MEKDKLIAALEHNAPVNPKYVDGFVKDLLNMTAPFDSLLERWVANSDDIEEYEIDGVSVDSLLKRGLSYPAALSTLNWIRVEGKTASEYVKSH